MKRTLHLFILIKSQFKIQVTMIGDALPLQFIQKAINNTLQDQKCSSLHKYTCNYKSLMQAINGTKTMGTVYLIVHLIPLIRKIKSNPKDAKNAFIKFLIGFSKSILFLSGSLFLIRRVICFFTEHWKYTRDAIYSGWVSGLALMLQSPGRQVQISLYSLTKGLEMIYFLIRRRNPGLWVRHGEKILNAIALGALSFAYIQDSSVFRSHYRSAFNFIIGKC